MSLEILLIREFVACCPLVLLHILRFAKAVLQEGFAFVTLQILFVCSLIALADFVLSVPGRHWHAAGKGKQKSYTEEVADCLFHDVFLVSAFLALSLGRRVVSSPGAVNAFSVVMLRV